MVSWYYLTQIFVLYIGSATLSLGLFGSMINSIIFLTNPMYRSQPSTFFLLISAITRFIHLFTIGLSRGLGVVFHIDVTCASLLWCKTRYYVVNSGFGIAVTCECLAAIDPFLVTSRSAKLRRLSSIRWSHRIGIGVVTFWLLQNIPYFIFADISSSICSIHNDFWDAYSVYVNNWLFFAIAPMSICVLFGILTYRNIRTLKARRQLQRIDYQANYMVFGQIVATIVPIIPGTFYFVYSSSAISLDEAAEKNSDYFIFNALNTFTAFFYGVSKIINIFHHFNN
ncbi:unnamed protein product [Adineta ricciae]|uniref:G-protein coupled receptors family 1 profile domain-containing protein n=1 Tax=Adineta ricciae TaxID=249248 RepID=A0A813QRU8_ADIRI|nr:unnamed protein product [Adineta ricciae]CAF1479360.1 unnamed protein product [Adineta ricciae]